MAVRFVIDIFEIKNHPAPIPTCAQVADTLRRVFVPRGVECSEGVAYMPVPRCDACAHWTPPTPPIALGSCAALRTTGQPSICTADEWGEFDSRADFGCVKWSAK